MVQLTDILLVYMIHNIHSAPFTISCSVRGRALLCLASAASSESSEVTEAVKTIVFFPSTTDPLMATANSEPSDSVILQMVRRRTTDEKVGVRKAALQALESLIRLDTSITSKEDVDVVYERCLDPALSVRKQAIVSLTVLTVERMDCTILHRLVSVCISCPLVSYMYCTVPEESC